VQGFPGVLDQLDEDPTGTRRVNERDPMPAGSRSGHGVDERETGGFEARQFRFDVNGSKRYVVQGLAAAL